MINHMEAAALRKLDPPANFVWYAWECLDGKDGPVMLTGCVSSGPITKGKRKGHPRYDGRAQRVVVTAAEIASERARFEQETGKCGECGGDGQVFAQWDHITGTSFRQCPSCKGVKPTQA